MRQASPVRGLYNFSCRPMSIAYRIDQDRRLALTRWSGRVTAEEFLAHVRGLCSHPGWPPAPEGRQLCDLRFASLDGSIDEGVIEMAAGLYGQHPGIDNLRVAIVADQAFWKAAKFDELYSRQGGNSIVFNTLGTACAWLGLSAADVEKELVELRTEKPASPAPAV